MAFNILVTFAMHFHAPQINFSFRQRLLLLLVLQDRVNPTQKLLPCKYMPCSPPEVAGCYNASAAKGSAHAGAATPAIGPAAAEQACHS